MTKVTNLFSRASSAKLSSKHDEKEVSFRSTRIDPTPIDNDDPQLLGFKRDSDLFRRALRREAVTNISGNRRLVDGVWVTHDQWQRGQKRRHIKIITQGFEIALAWGALGLVGVALMALISLII